MDDGRSSRNRLIAVIAACLVALIAVPGSFLLVAGRLDRRPTHRTNTCRNVVARSGPLPVGTPQAINFAQEARPVIDVDHRFWLPEADLPHYAELGQPVRGTVVLEAPDVLRFTPTGPGPSAVFHLTSLLRNDCN